MNVKRITDERALFNADANADSSLDVLDLVAICDIAIGR